MSKRVLSIGNCSFDHRALSEVIESNFPAQVMKADTLPDALSQLKSGPFDLVLVNRQLDSDGSEGLQVIEQMKTDSALRHIPVMMITNFSEHQANAQQAGAVEGFGKHDLQSSEAVDKLRPFLSDG